MNRSLKIALLLSLVFNLTLTLNAAYTRSYDAYTHMFLADHYKKTWYDTWEPRWYTGFQVTSYPPLTHQVIALLSLSGGVELGYATLSIILTLLLPIAIYYFSRIFLSKEESGYAALLGVFTPSITMTNYVFGQLPTLFSLASSLLLGYYLNRFLTTGSKKKLAISIALMGVATSSHHLTALFFVPTIVLLISIKTLLEKRHEERKTLIRRLRLFIFSSLIVSLIAIWPFWAFIMNAPMQTEIPHLSRSNLFSSPEAFILFFLGMYGPTILLFPFIATKFVKERHLLPLLLATTTLLILGLGGTTPIPRILFGDRWSWLTYDRFTIWASTLMCPLLAAFFSTLKPKHSTYGKSLLLLSLIGTSAIVGNLTLFIPIQPDPIDIKPIVTFLEKDDHFTWRYLTLGFGSQSSLIAIESDASTVDGNYPTARTLPIMLESGAENIDGAKHWNGGHTLLEEVLNDTETYNLKWVFSNDQSYEETLTKNNFTQLYTFNGGVSTWEKKNTPPIENPHRREKYTLEQYAWGIIPTTLLAISLSLIAHDSTTTTKKRSTRQNLHGHPQG